MLLFILILVFCNQAISDDDNTESVIVSIRQGKLQAKEFKNQVTNESFYAFFDVPYAAPPVGDKRFKPPEEHQGWEDVHESTEDEKNDGCKRINPIFQMDEGEEDCLFLHVFTPKKPEELQNDLKAVMVWIHGGAFHFGSGSANTYGPDFLVKEDVVLVMMNYRLNVFGFLCTDDEEASGNAGLKDQVMALKWVQENIKAFGGNPDMVTIFGESAGGASIHYLLLSPTTKGLFHRAIAQSGSALNPWAMSTQTQRHATKLGDFFDCEFSNSKELIKCLRNVSDGDLANYQYNIISINQEVRDAFVYLPCVEKEGIKGAFLTKHPQDLLKEGKFHDVPFMTGTMLLETLPLMRGLESSYIPEDGKKAIYRNMNLHPEALLPPHWQIKGYKKRRRMGRKVKQFYFKNLRVSNATLAQLVNQSTDTSFLLGTHNMVTYHSKFSKSPVYQYYFTLDTSYGKIKNMLSLNKIKGPTHADDIGYTFYMYSSPQSLNPVNIGFQAAMKITKMWANFAKFGNPTPDSELGFIWEPTKPDKRYYLEIGEEFTLKEYVEERRMKFWEKLQLDEGIDIL